MNTMKLNKAFMAFSFLLIGLTGCNTENLENDINALKDRVALMEAQVQALNDNMNILRIALDGNKTIQKCTDNGDGSYSLLLSDGSTFKLTQGVEGSEFYPQISVDGNGYWVIDGVTQDYKAKAEDGKDGQTPLFRLDAEGDKYYWSVSYDNGVTYNPLLDVLGNKVQANAEASITPSDDRPITDVKVSGDCLKFKVDGQDYSIPIVEGLVCQITIPEDSKDGDFCVVSTKAPSVLAIEASGDYCLVNATEGWTASVNEGKNQLTITAPKEADKEGVITLQVNKGINWATEKIKVKSRYIINSYLEEYNSGYDILIGDEKINKESGYTVANYGNVVQDKGTITGSGIHFIAAGAEITVPATITVNDLILICDKPGAYATVKLEGNALFTIKSTVENGCLMSKNIDFTVNPTKNAYVLNLSECKSAFKLISDNCKYSIANAKNLSFSSTVSTIGKIHFKDCNIYFEGDGTTSQNSNFINLRGATINDAIFENNLFTAEKKANSTKISLIVASKVTPTILNNTFFNVISANNLVKATIVDMADGKKWTIKNNIFYSENFTGTANLIFANNGTEYGEESDLRFSPNITNYTLRYFTTATGAGKPSWVEDAGKYMLDKTTEPIFNVPTEQTDMTTFDFDSLIDGFGCSKRVIE